MSFWERWFEPKPFNSGYVPVSDMHKIYFHEYGNPKGRAIVCLHGGPGYYSRSSTAADFNLKKFRVILFDQRGCGKSVPAGETKENTIVELSDDILKLLAFLNIKEKIIVYGSSWGSTLALYFAENHPDKVERLILTKIFLANEDNAAWETKYSGWLYPDVWEKVSSPAEGENVPLYYNLLLKSNVRKNQEKAVRLYGRYEFALGALTPPEVDDMPVSDEDINICKIYTNYAANKFFLKENELFENVKVLENIPIDIFHNRLDLLCPLVGAYQLAQRLKKCRLRIVPALGHGSDEMRREVKQFLKKL